DEDPWIEVADEFGRTRIIRTSEKGGYIKRFVKEGNSSLSNDNSDSTPTLVSNDMRLAMERERWEEEARKEMNEPYIRNVNHYNSKSEIRNLGVGFYQFAQSDEERKKQMNELKDMRNETINSRDITTQIQQIRKNKIEERKKLILEKKKKKLESLDSGQDIFKQVEGENVGDDTVEAFL
ncbi:hypothetical protein HK096_008404, partial [Nowakowskiella sp. JEL0078]